MYRMGLWLGNLRRKICRVGQYHKALPIYSKYFEKYGSPQGSPQHLCEAFLEGTTVRGVDGAQGACCACLEPNSVAKLNDRLDTPLHIHATTMSSRNFTFDIFTDGVRAMDEDRQLKQPDEIETRAPCAIDRRACTYHRGRSNEPALLPTPAPVRFTSWVSRLKAKAREVVSSFKGQPQQNVNLAIICADFRFPALKSSKCFLRSTAPCCLLLKVNVYCISLLQFSRSIL